MVKKAAQATPNSLLRAARKERGWTQQQVADLIGAALPLNVTRWERGTAFPSAHYAQELSRLFGKTPRELGLLELDGEEDEEKLAPETLKYWQVPYRRNLFFTGREELLSTLKQALLDEGKAALTQSYALSGLGGIGKTQLALEYAYRSREQYQAVFWVRATSLTTLSTDLSALARLLAVPECENREQQIVIEAVMNWFSRNQGWLLILDNADDLTLIKNFAPTGGQGHLLLTTRAQATGKLAISIEVEKMDLEEGMRLLLSRAKLLAAGASLALVKAPMLAQARKLVQALDGLPLAIDQAAAYIEESGCGLQEYLRLYEGRRMDLLKRASATMADYPETVASTWSLSFQQVEQANEAAPQLLRLCAFLDADAIPETMLGEGAAQLGSVLGSAVADGLQWNEVLRVLRQYSLIRRHSEKGLLQIHRLVQVVIQADMNEQTRRLWAERAVLLVNAAFPDVTVESWGRCQQLLPHARVCADLIEGSGFLFPEAARLLHQSGWYLRERGHAAQAESFLQQALTIYEQSCGPDHIETAACLNHLGTLAWDQSQYAQAESFYQRSLDIRERILGQEHLSTAASYNNLGNLYWAQGRYAQAEPMYRRALALYEQRPVEAARLLAQTLANLAVLSHHLGRYAQAESLHHRALAIREEQFGPRHLEVAQSLMNLGVLCDRQGRYAQAESFLQRALSIREEQLGPDHPSVALVYQNLGELYQRFGRYVQAEELYQRALSIRERVLGLSHPDVAYSLHSLATLCQICGHSQQAQSLYQRALHIREQALGEAHPDVAQSLYDLALLYQDLSQNEQALSLLQRALAIREQSPGPQHPDTLATRAAKERLLALMTPNNSDPE